MKLMVTKLQGEHFVFRNPQAAKAVFLTILGV